MRSKSSRKYSLPIPSRKYDLSQFGVIAVIFNPIKYISRYELYHKFEQHMTRSGVKLLTVECIFQVDEQLGLPIQKFEITRSNDPQHLQIKAPSVLWLKENLINIAVKHLPSDVKYIAWLDADIEFETLDWPHLTMDQLERYPIVQLFQSSFFLGPSNKKRSLHEDYSFVYAIKHRQRIDPYRSSQCHIHPGYAWAMRREVFDQLGGLLDFAILGSGDMHFAYGLLNRIEETIPPDIHEQYRCVAIAWGQRLAQLAGNGRNVGYVPVNIWHYWHGHRRDRRYKERWSLLEQCHFSPLIDLEKSNKTGVLRLARSTESNSSQRLKLLEKNIIEYFRLRDEDNIKKPVPTLNTCVMINQPTGPAKKTFHSTNNLSFYHLRKIAAVEDDINHLHDSPF